MKKNKNEETLTKKFEKFSEKKFTDKMSKITNSVISKYGLKLNKEGNAVDCEADAFRHAYMQW